jgi:hypothetical protein
MMLLSLPRQMLCWSKCFVRLRLRPMSNLPLLRMLRRQRNDWAALDAQLQTKLNLK